MNNHDWATTPEEIAEFLESVSYDEIRINNGACEFQLRNADLRLVVEPVQVCFDSQSGEATFFTVKLFHQGKPVCSFGEIFSADYLQNNNRKLCKKIAKAWNGTLFPVTQKEEPEKAIPVHATNTTAIKAAEQVLIDNGIDADEAQIVLQAIGYVLLDAELYPKD